MLWSERRQLAKNLKETRTPVEIVTQADWKPTPANSSNYLDRETEALAREKAEKRLYALPAAERRLKMLQEIAERQEPTEEGTHTNLDKVEAILDAVASNPERTRAEYDYAERVWQQHQRGMSKAVANEMFAQLEQQELAYRQSKMDSLKVAQAQLMEQQSALAAEIRAMDPMNAQIDALREQAAAALQEVAAGGEDQ